MIGRPCARFFGFLTLFWLPVSLCSSHPFWEGWPESFGSLEWLGGGALLLQAVFAAAALVFLLTEKSRSFSQTHSNPDYDIRKLY